MAGTKLYRTAALTALWRGLTSGAKGGPTLGQRLSVLPRMFANTLTGRYDGFGRLLLVVGAAAYVVSPLDLIPELALGPFGLLDDAIIATWLAGAVLAETERFMAWEGGRDTGPRTKEQTTDSGPILDGEVVSG
jgi:uncharacterized membrane protein YkvA (DUF1232 family)